MADEQPRQIPPEDTREHFDYLIEALVEEVLIYAYYDTSPDPVNFHIGMLRAAYQRALERKDGDAGDQG